MKNSSFKIFSLVTILALMLAAMPVRSAQAISPDIVISQVYGAGGNSGAPYKNDFVELFNRGSSTVSLTGWSVQYASATGTGNFGANPITLLSGSLQPGQYYLVQLAGGTNGVLLPTADATGTVNMSGTGGKVALVMSTTGLACNGGSTPCSAAQLALIKDLVGWDGANFYETSPGPSTAASTSTSIVRANGGCTDTDNNSTDFSTIAPPTPRNTASTLNVCPAATNPTGVGTATPNTIATGDSTLLTVAVTPGTNPTSTGLAVTANLSPIGGSSDQTFFDDGTNGDVTSGDQVFSYQLTAASLPACGASLSFMITDAQLRQGSGSIALTVGKPAAIHDIQGASHLSPLSGECVINSSGIVTAKRSNGFYIEEPATNWDGDTSTSEGIFVFTSSAPTTIHVGDGVVVTGTPVEFRSGGASSTNLTTTEISTPGRSFRVISSGNTLPEPVIIGTDGRIPPAMVIEDDATGDVETSGIFDPATDGIDFYESLEGMLVQVNDAVATGPWHNFGSNREIPVVGDKGANAGVRTPRGGVIIQPTDFNPERIILNDLIVDGPTLPSVNVGDSFPGATVGVMDYSFGNFKLQVISLPPFSDNGLQQEVATPASANQLAVATFNVENLAPTDPPSKFATLAELVVNHLQSPDVIAIEEIQDNTGVTDDGTVDASTTWGMLISAIQDAGGPTYQYRQIDPVNDQDGGATGGNIRQGFLFRTDRGLSFIDRPGAGSTTANAVLYTGANTQLQYSPGRIDPTNTAFSTSRKPLAGEFMFNGRHLFVIANHFNSKGGDDPLFGRFQPPTFISEVQRHQQATVVHDFANALLTADPNASVVVLGDLNDFEFSGTVSILKGAILNDLMDRLPQNERYSYVYEGNSETLDQTLVSSNLINNIQLKYDVVHVNSEFANQASDHEPQVTYFVTYPFKGFFQPVDNLPTWNLAKAGSAVPVKFSLGGDQGLNIFAPGYPKSEQIVCKGIASLDNIEQTITAGSSGLSYDSLTDTYTYVWKTSKTWIGSCRQLIVKLNDGLYYRAYFEFK